MRLLYTLLITLLIVWILTLAGVLFLAWSDSRQRSTRTASPRASPAPRNPARAE